MTIFWALQLTQIADLHTNIMEGDAKICFDALNLGLLNFEWSTSVPLNDVVEISRCFDSCAFCWVRREAKCLRIGLLPFVLPMVLKELRKSSSSSSTLFANTFCLSCCCCCCVFFFFFFFFLF